MISRDSWRRQFRFYARIISQQIKYKGKFAGRKYKVYLAKFHVSYLALRGGEICWLFGKIPIVLWLILGLLCGEICSLFGKIPIITHT